ncbi:AMP nucleosidase [Paracraurococcus ruber]|uniref:AMP nucleosidase n=1 Tax=Paracraurococcus ruber TaxID=77675 RepID=A0ABS1CXE0_9PROT|nr:AMP nucleosidase [Paracraurococcus ruber]MBK1659095.1 AMP nucleosidase [Paracraurococcus ruber]TDG32543.1 AMP nucleosidase [Paracraurococcus ruber]
MDHPIPSLTPEAAVARLEALHAEAVAAQRAALERLLAGGPPPDAAERARFTYPELRLTWAPGETPGSPPAGAPPATRRAWARFQQPGCYAVTVTQPGHFRPYLLEQLQHLAADFAPDIAVRPSTQEIPYPYVFERGDAFDGDAVSGALLARHFPAPSLAEVGDEVPDSLWRQLPEAPFPLALFDAVRVDYSLRRLVHYTGTDWRQVQPWILLTNYHRYVDQFIRWGLAELAREGSPWQRLVLPGGVAVARGEAPDAEALVAATAWHRFQMPAYHLLRADGTGGVTLVNIGVGPSNAKTITDHLAVLRPHCWLMVGHCAGLRHSQAIGDYVLAHGYLRRDRILDELVPPEVPIPALAEVQVALQQAAARVTGEEGDALKRRLRTGTVVTYDDRNWELRWSRERRRINLSRAIAVDMESGTLAAQGYRFRVPYGTLLCVSDRPLHGEIKLPGTASAFYERAVGQHLMIGLATLDILRGQLASLHSRKLRSFDEPPFR